MKFTAALLAASVATTTAFAPAAQNARCTTSLSETLYKIVGRDSPAASSKEDDLEKTLSVVMEYLQKEDSDSSYIDDSDDDTPYIPPTPPPAPKAAAPAPAPAASSTGIKLWSVDYDAAAMLAYKAAGSSGDFASFKTKYLADTSAMVGKKNPYKK